MEEISNEVNATEEEEVASTDDVLKELHSQATEISNRYRKHVTRLLQTKDEPATKGDIAELYRAMASDVVYVLGESIAENAAAFRDFGEILEDLGDSDGGDDELTEETIQLYTTLKTNINAFEQLVSSPIPDNQKEAFSHMLAMNNDAVKNLEEQYGDELKEAFEETLKQAQAANGDDKKEEVGASAN